MKNPNNQTNNTQNEIEIFDKAVKNIYPNWVGCKSANDKDYSKIKTLSFKDFGISHLPYQIEKCPNLKHIDLLDNNDIDWKDCFNKVKETDLNSVFVSIKDLSDIDSTNWKFITGIKFSKNVLNQSDIFHQKQLIYLNLSYNFQLNILPKEIGNLTNLIKLDLQFTSLKNLPPEIGYLTNLTELNLKGSLLNSLPSEIGNLTKLTELNLWKNKLDSLPLEIGNLTSLSKLCLFRNKVSSLPPEIGNLTNLTEIDLNDNLLKYLPPEIGNLKNLTKLYLNGNELRSLPPEIGNLKKLKELDLGYNYFSTSEEQKIDNWFKDTECKIYW